MLAPANNKNGNIWSKIGSSITGMAQRTTGAGKQMNKLAAGWLATKEGNDTHQGKNIDGEKYSAQMACLFFVITSLQ